MEALADLFPRYQPNDTNVAVYANGNAEIFTWKNKLDLYGMWWRWITLNIMSRLSAPQTAFARCCFLELRGRSKLDCGPMVGTSALDERIKTNFV